MCSADARNRNLEEGMKRCEKGDWPRAFRAPNATRDPAPGHGCIGHRRQHHGGSRDEITSVTVFGMSIGIGAQSEDRMLREPNIREARPGEGEQIALVHVRSWLTAVANSGRSTSRRDFRVEHPGHRCVDEVPSTGMYRCPRTPDEGALSTSDLDAPRGGPRQRRLGRWIRS
jgi:hypothetical protein